jgi:tetratricopeptide (TPR) repeat protein
LGVVKIIAVAVVLGLITACNPQTKLFKQARIQSNNGMYEDAANLYYNILLTDSKNKLARAELKNNAQKVIADKFAKFSKLVIEDRIEEALKTYKHAKEYTQNAAKVGVLLEWPHEYDEVYNDIKNEYTQQQYDIAVGLIQNRKYEAAEKVFGRIALYDSSYKDVSVLRLNTVLEPLYAKATEQYNNKQFKEAYYAFNKIVQIDDQYKDAQKMRTLSIQQATSIVGVLPLQLNTNTHYNITSIADALADLIGQQQGGYVKIANVQALHRDLESRGFNGFKTTSQAAEAGKSLNLGYVILLQLDTFEYVKQTKQTVVREGYEAFTESILNPYTKTYSSISKFKKATYTDNTEGQQVYMVLKVALIQVNTGDVLLNEVVTVFRKDELHAAKFNGNPNNLYPNLPEGNYLPQVSREWRDMFFNPRKNLLPVNDLINQAVYEATSKMATFIQPKLR